MWEYIIYSILFVLGTLIADYLCSVMFENSRKLKQAAFEIILFLVVSNYLLVTTKVSGNQFVIAFLYFFYSFLSMIFSRVLGFLIFSRALSKVSFNKNEISKSSLKLAKNLSAKLSKREVLDYFRLSGFSAEFVEHLDKVLKE